MMIKFSVIIYIAHYLFPANFSAPEIPKHPITIQVKALYIVSLITKSFPVYPVIKSNSAVSAFTDLSSASTTGQNNTYRGDFSTTKAVCIHKSAVGTVKLLDLALESERDARRQGTLMIAKMAVGSDYLRSESAVEIKIS